jgi:BirA family biotin operon repressor/biotin-[acetyl-CoA-carboxylase] ligase
VSRRAALVRRLADGAFHSGEALARELGVTRAAVAKQVRALETWGLQVDSVPRRGHRLRTPLDLLDAASLPDELAPATRGRLRRLEVHDEIDSTNSRLLAAGDLPAGRFDACLAEWQSAGRGRRGRGWLAPFGGGLCLSFGWTFREPGSALASLALAVGVAVLRALRALGVHDLRLKWPNDLLLDGRKLGGILCELRAEASGPAYVVVGLGLNVRLAAEAAREVVERGGLPPASLSELTGFAVPRTRLAACVLDELVAMALEFERAGLAPFRDEWSAADALADRPVTVLGHAGARHGVARGIDASGELRVEIDGRLVVVTAGDVSLRAES